MYYKQPLERVSTHWKITISDPRHELPRCLNVLYRTKAPLSLEPLSLRPWLTDQSEVFAYWWRRSWYFFKHNGILLVTYSLIAMYLTIQGSTLLRSSLLTLRGATLKMLQVFDDIILILR